ncbi:hypothetical protein CDAR_313891 [Caerostris darwini]|uniref:Uncharacterized protein n=1 Tax=Caerostris darwini TaxID=1538125 RepID=A0AAV4QHP3_9ARAC|nr:hypothetical protein CDAR_313891 [Caerostris darwini]
MAAHSIGVKRSSRVPSKVKHRFWWHREAPWSSDRGSRGGVDNSIGIKGSFLVPSEVKQRFESPPPCGLVIGGEGDEVENPVKSIDELPLVVCENSLSDAKRHGIRNDRAENCLKIKERTSLVFNYNTV